MKYLVKLMFLMLIWSPINSQVTLKEGQVKTFINNGGDTLIVMNIKDAKSILIDVLECEILDSTVAYYQKMDKEKTKIIFLQKQLEVEQNKKIENLEKEINNCNTIVGNKDKEIGMQNEIISEQRKEIRKQKLLKIAGFSGSIILPVLTAIIILK